MIWIYCDKDSDYVYQFDGTLDEWQRHPDAHLHSVSDAARKFGEPAEPGVARQWCIDNKVKRVPLLDNSWKPYMGFPASFRIIPQTDQQKVLVKLRWG